MEGRVLKSYENYVILIGVFVILGLVSAYNPDGQADPPVFGHSAGEIEGIENFSTNYSIGVGTLLDNPEIIMEVNYNSSSGPQGPFYGVIDVRNNPNIPNSTKEVLVYAISRISEEYPNYPYGGSWYLEADDNPNYATHTLISLNSKWNNSQGNFLVWMPLKDDQTLDFVVWEGPYMPGGTRYPGAAYVKVEVQGYRA